MKSRSILTRVLMLAAILALAGGATGTSCSTIGGGGGGDQPVFVATLAVRDAAGADTDIFDVAEPVTLVLTIRNRKNSEETATFTTSRTSDFVVVKDGTDNVLWQQSGGQAGTGTGTAATQITFAARETKTFTATWNQTDNAGNQLDEGTYEVRGALVYDGFDSNPLALNETGSTPVEFTISRINR